MSKSSKATKKQTTTNPAVEVVELKPKYTIFHIEGGIGKHVSSTAVVKAYKKQNPDRDIIVVCAWPEIYINNKDIHRVYRLGNVPYFYQDYIFNKDVEIYSQEPYKETSHITKKEHLIKTWCNMIGVEYNGEMPYIHFNVREREIIDKELGAIKKTKPMLLFQPFGGPGKEHQAHPYSWVRDIPPIVAQQIVDKLKEQYMIVHICYDFHPQLNGAIRFEKNVSKKELFNLINFSDKRLFIDSSLQHAAAALNKPSTVVWVGTSPEIFGYGMHTNVTPINEFPEGHIDSYLYDYNFTGAIHECPYDAVDEIHTADRIIAKL